MSAMTPPNGATISRFAAHQKICPHGTSAALTGRKLFFGAVLAAALGYGLYWAFKNSKLTKKATRSKKIRRGGSVTRKYTVDKKKKRSKKERKQKSKKGKNKCISPHEIAEALEKKLQSDPSFNSDEKDAENKDSQTPQSNSSVAISPKSGQPGHADAPKSPAQTDSATSTNDTLSAAILKAAEVESKSDKTPSSNGGAKARESTETQTSTEEPKSSTDTDKKADAVDKTQDENL